MSTVNIQQQQSFTSKIILILPWIVCGLAAGFYCYEYLLRITPGIMVEHLQIAFKQNGLPLDATQIGHLSAFYYYAYTPMQLPVGIMMDRYGPRNILTMAVLSCAVGTLLFATTSEIMIASIGRFLIGFGSAFAFVGVLKLATIWLPPNRFALVSGLATTLGMIGAMFGETYLTVLVEDIGWRETLNYSSYIGFVLFPIIWLIVRDTPPREDMHHVDVSAVKEISYKEMWLDTLLALKNKQIWINGLVGCLMMAPTVVFAELWGASYFKTVYGFSIAQATKAVSMMFLGWAIGGPLVGYLSDKIQRRKPLLTLGSLIVTLLLFFTLYYPGLSFHHICILLFLVGFFSSAEIICFAIGRENCPMNLAGTVVAVTNFMVVCSAAFQVLAGHILDKTWDGTMVDMMKVYSADSYHAAMLLLPVLSFGAFLLSFFLKETHCKQVVKEIS